MKYKTFIFNDYNFNADSKTLYLHYSYDNELFFEETIQFPSERPLGEKELKTLDNIFKYIHIACGISYYKLFLVDDIKINTFLLNEEQANFFNEFYRKGLGEFSFKNNITDIDKRINFPYSGNVQNKASDVNLVKKILIPIGGGKDSITTLEIIKTIKNVNDILTCSVGTSKCIDDEIKMSGCASFHPIRTISANLLELNKRLEEIGGYNGHVPISGILAFVMSACAVIYGFDTILMSNERSANVGNVEFNGNVVNHQWSKSFEFEKSINSFFKKYLLKNLTYISFLRPLYEINIVKLFSKLKQYHNVFRSCNKNFKINNRIENWCCECDKCRFIFLMLAVFLTKNELVKIFGKDLLNDEEQLQGFMELCGLDGHKPFDCVGEVKECVFAILKVDNSFKNDYVVKKLQPLLEDVDVNEIKKDLFSLGDEHLLSEDLIKALTNYINKQD